MTTDFTSRQMTAAEQAAMAAMQAAMANLFAAPTSRSLSFATAYQATDPTKPAVISVLIDTVVTVGVGSPTANTVELITGPTNAVASGTGFLADRYRNDLSVTLISLGFTGSSKLVAILPTGHYFAVRRTVGTGSSINSAFDQAVG